MRKYLVIGIVVALFALVLAAITADRAANAADSCCPVSTSATSAPVQKAADPAGCGDCCKNCDGCICCAECAAKLQGPDKAAYDAYVKKTADVRKNLQTACKELSAVLSKTPVDRAQALAIVDRISSLQREMLRETVDLRIAVGPCTDCEKQCAMKAGCGMMSGQCPMGMSQGCAMSEGAHADNTQKKDSCCPK